MTESVCRPVPIHPCTINACADGCTCADVPPLSAWPNSRTTSPVSKENSWACPSPGAIRCRRARTHKCAHTYSHTPHTTHTHGRPTDHLITTLTARHRSTSPPHRSRLRATHTLVQLTGSLGSQKTRCARCLYPSAELKTDFASCRCGCCTRARQLGRRIVAPPHQRTATRHSATLPRARSRPTVR